jgi:hypothetical protein
VWRPHFYVSIKRAEPASFEVIVNHDNITDITTYLRLCSRPHKRKYEAISMMLSWLMHGTSRRVLWVGSSQELFRR